MHLPVIRPELIVILDATKKLIKTLELQTPVGFPEIEAKL